MLKLKQNLNKYVISFLIFTITLFGAFSFFINKDIIDNLINYYIIFVSGIAILILLLNNLNDFKPKNLKKISLMIIVLTLIWITITAFMGIRTNIEALKGIVNYSCLLILGYTITNIHLSQSDKKFILNTIYVSCFICIIIGIWQYFSGINLITYSNDLYPGILGRINSTFYIATMLDKYFVLIAVLLMYTLIKKPKKKLVKILYILVGIGIGLTFSRSGQLIFLFVSGVFFLFSLFKKQIGNLLTVILTILIILLIPGTTTSLQSGLDFVYEKINLPEALRVDITFIDDMIDNLFEEEKTGKPTSNSKGDKDDDDDDTTSENKSLTYRDFYKGIGLQLIKEYPIFGIGVGNYSYLINNQNFADYLENDEVLDFAKTYRYPHSNTVQVAAEIGYIGLILLFLSILSFSCYINFKKDKMLVVTLFMLIVCLLLSGYTEGVFNSKQYIFIFILIYTFLCAKEKEDNNEQKEKLLKLFGKTFKGTKKEYIKEIETALEKNKKKFIVTANPEAFMTGLNDENYMNILMDKNTTIIPDGIGIIKAGRCLNYDFKERIAGIDLTENLLKLANEHHKKIYLFGAQKEVNKKLQKIIKEKYKNIEIAGAYDGYEENKEKVFKEMIKKEPDIVLVALGMPLQEELIYKYFDKFKKGIFIGVGGTFDVLSGSKKRAPKILIKLNLEWFYRIIKEPKRIKKFWNNNVKFMWYIKNL